jgi:hypothetical protein
MLGRACPARHLPAQQTHRGLGDTFMVRVDGGEAGRDEAGHVEVVEPGELDIDGHTKPALCQGRDRAERDDVGDGEDAVEGQTGRDDVEQGIACGRRRVGGDGHHIACVDV